MGKIAAVIILLLECCTASLKLSADVFPTYAIWNGSSWGSNPPNSIPGAIADNNTTVVTVYDAGHGTVMATWLDPSLTPTYAIWNGTSWTVSATVISGAGASATSDVSTVYDAGHGTVMATWLDSSGTPTYAIWNGASWTVSATAISGAGANVILNVSTVYDAMNETIIAVWNDSSNTPNYAVWNGSSWIIPATVIPGAPPAVFLAVKDTIVYDAQNGTVLAMWNTGGPTPVYTVWDGALWSPDPPADIPDTVYASTGISAVYNAGNHTVVVAFVYGDVGGPPSFLPTYAIWNGASWSTPGYSHSWNRYSKQHYN